MTFVDLADARHRILGASSAALAHLSGITPPRMAEIEQAGVGTYAELVSIGRVLGIEPDALGESPIEVEDPMVDVLPYVEEFQDVSSLTRARIIAAASAGLDVSTLHTQLGEPATWLAYQARQPLAHPRKGAEPFAEGRHYATKLRARLGLRRQPILSMRDFMATHFPEVAILHADLADPKLAGVSLADPVRGPLIVLNTTGKNENPLVRRFSLAHELGHLLFDNPKGSSLAQLSGYKNDHQLAIERRANAFAIRLLCPEPVVADIVRRVPSDLARARQLIEGFGLHYQAARLHLKNVAGVTLPDEMPAPLVGVGAQWAEAEDPGLHRLPLVDIPPERSTLVAQNAALAWARGLIGRGRFAELLRVDRTQPLDRVLAAFGLGSPEA